ncbi:MAG TPA: hypothetical protein VFH56_14390 [Acidimicrobiales bacterium]|nr:hypothetical protein [Acidimicrobiales bacterium]
MACTTGCPTQNHSSYAECLKAKAPRVAWANSAGNLDLTTERKWERDLAAYKDARRQGIQPQSTQRAAVDRAVRISNETGVAYQA